MRRGLNLFNTIFWEKCILAAFSAYAPMCTQYGDNLYKNLCLSFKIIQFCVPGHHRSMSKLRNSAKVTYCDICDTGDQNITMRCGDTWCRSILFTVV